MRNIMQEKFEVRVPQPEKNGGNWASDSAARDKKNQGGEFNALPPGSDIRRQSKADIPRMGMSIAGNMPSALAKGDVTNNEVNPKSLRAGFDKKSLRPTDDNYTNEHVDLFYADVGGFCERGNLLDRL